DARSLHAETRHRPVRTRTRKSHPPRTNEQPGSGGRHPPRSEERARLRRPTSPCTAENAETAPAPRGGAGLAETDTALYERARGDDTRPARRSGPAAPTPARNEQTVCGGWPARAGRVQKWGPSSYLRRARLTRAEKAVRRLRVRRSAARSRRRPATSLRRAAISRRYSTALLRHLAASSRQRTTSARMRSASLASRCASALAASRAR